MKTESLRVNVINLKREIQKDYFKYKDIFYKCLIGNLCIYNQTHGLVLHNTIIDDGHYNQYLAYNINKQSTIEDILKDMDTPFNMYIFLDLQVYFEDFIRVKHNKAKLNIYHLTVDDGYNLVISNKTINYVK